MYFNNCPPYLMWNRTALVSLISSVLILKRHYFRLISLHYHLCFFSVVLICSLIISAFFSLCFGCETLRLHYLITGVRFQVTIDNRDVMMYNRQHSTHQSTQESEAGLGSSCNFSFRSVSENTIVHSLFSHSLFSPPSPLISSHLVTKSRVPRR